jgi:hypothetical protein
LKERTIFIAFASERYMKMMAVLIDARISAPAPCAFGGTDRAIKDDVFNAFVRLGEKSKLISNIGHEIGLGLTRDISIDVARSNNPRVCKWYVVASAFAHVSCIRDPPVARPITIRERVIELFSKLYPSLA